MGDTSGERSARIDATDESLAIDLARAAGTVLLSLRCTGLLSGRELGAAGDAVSHQLLTRALAFHRPADAVLSEEAAADPARLDSARVWIIDPLDGTREYGEGREDWAVHVALAIDGVPGPSAVALPALDRICSSAHPTALPAPSTGAPAAPLRIAVSRSRPPHEAETVAVALEAKLVPMGSAGFKAMAVLSGAADAYLHAGGQYEWDSAAPVGVVVAAGLHASRIDGSPLLYNRPDPLLPDLLICRPELADQLLEVLAATPEAPL